MKIFAKHKKKGYKEDNSGWSEPWKSLLDTEALRRHTGRRMFILINKPKIRRILSAAKYSGNF